MRSWWGAATLLVAAASAQAGEQTLYFGGHAAPVRVVRGGAPGAAVAGAIAAAARCHAGGPAACAGVETVSFGDGRGETVTVVRGTAPLSPPAAEVAVVRGATLAAGGLGLFSPRGGELDRIAFAVEGVESGHGTNPAMWRAEPGGPQGPMQVSAAAALDVGGGDRFDPDRNRVLGRAFLARLYQRYGNWPDALGAYDWGPGNLDAWIAAGRPEDRLPLETARYIEMVLRDAVLGKIRL